MSVSDTSAAGLSSSLKWPYCGWPREAQAPGGCSSSFYTHFLGPVSSHVTSAPVTRRRSSIWCSSPGLHTYFCSWFGDKYVNVLM